MAMQLEDIIKRPLMLTEKGNILRETQNQFLFEVDRRANKIQIRQAVEKLFQVKVIDVRTLIVRGHMRRMGRGHEKTKNWKKAIVHVKDGDTIEFFEGAGA
jgi:large subunit ribosomal protein L23